MIAASVQMPSVLIVEDERIVAKALHQALSGMGYDPLPIASSADEAMACVSERRPDIVLMDIRIKGPLDGIQTAEILKRQFDLPVVYLTAYADDATIERAKVTEPYGYLLKPVKLAELRSAIEISLFKHRMERRLRERERWFSTTLRSIADAVVAVDIGGKVSFLNPAAEALIGLPAGEVIGEPASTVLRRLGERSAKASETPLDTALRVMQTVEPHEVSLLNRTTGERRLISQSAAPVVDEKLTLGAVMVFRDITEQKKLQKRLEFADRLASLGTMAASAAHELNNPLSIVMANAGFVAQGLVQHRTNLRTGVSLQAVEPRLDEIAGALEDIQSAASRMATIISDLRTLSRPAQGTPGLVSVALCVQWAVRATSHEFRHRARLFTRLGDVPLVQADEARLGQVIVNLLVNAAQAIPPGNFDQNEVSVTTCTDDRGRAVVEVRDTGTGIPPDVLPRIFDPFFTTRGVGSGTGLGLAICHGIVRSLGGEVIVDSKIEKGSTFRVLLPPASTVTPAPPGVGQTAQPRRSRILVVDDEEMLLRIIRLTLESEDHEVVCTQNALEALALVERGERFDVVLCDLMMPNMTGMAFYETLLNRHRDLAGRIVFMTGGATTAKTGDFLRSIPNLLVEKPFSPNGLLEQLQGLLAAPQAESGKASTEL